MVHGSPAERASAFFFLVEVTRPFFLVEREQLCCEPVARQQLGFLSGKKEVKGQTVIFEQVLLFAVGIAIFLACITVFSIAQDFYVQTAAGDQAKQVRELVASEIQAAANAGNGTNATVGVTVPREIQGEVYQLVLDGSGLNVSIARHGVWSFSNLGRANESFNLSGVLSSNNGRVTVEKKLGAIRIV